MRNTLSTIVGVIIFYFIVPIVLAVIVAKLFVGNHGTILTIIFFSLIALEIASVIIKLIKVNNNKN